MVGSLKAVGQAFGTELFCTFFFSKGFIIMNPAIASEAFGRLDDIESALFAFFAGVESATAADWLLFIATVKFIGNLA